MSKSITIFSWLASPSSVWQRKHHHLLFDRESNILLSTDPKPELRSAILLAPYQEWTTLNRPHSTIHIQQVRSPSFAPVPKCWYYQYQLARSYQATNTTRDLDRQIRPVHARIRSSPPTHRVAAAASTDALWPFGPDKRSLVPRKKPDSSASCTYAPAHFCCSHLQQRLLLVICMHGVMNSALFY